MGYLRGGRPPFGDTGHRGSARRPGTLDADRAVDRTASTLRARERSGVRTDPRLLRGPLEERASTILWNLDWLVVESFAPDFWLPDLELYIEMTTLKQSLVRKKNCKLRRLRELYPAIRIKLFYGR